MDITKLSFSVYRSIPTYAAFVVKFSGIIATTKDGHALGTVSEQTAEVLHKIEAAAASARVRLENIVSLTVILAPDMKKFEEFNEAFYRGIANWGPQAPTRVIFSSPELALGALVEIAAEAYMEP